MWIVRLALRRPYTFVVAAILLLILGPVSILRTPTDIFPNFFSVRTHTDDHGKQHRAHRVAIPEWNRRRKNILSSWRQYRQCGRAGDGGFSDSIASTSAGHHASPGHSIQRLKRAHSATRTVRPRPFRAAIGRHGIELHPNRPRHRCRSRKSVSLRRQAEAGASRPRHNRAAVVGPFAA